MFEIGSEPTFREAGGALAADGMMTISLFTCRFLSCTLLSKQACYAGLVHACVTFFYREANEGCLFFLAMMDGQKYTACIVHDDEVGSACLPFFLLG